MCFQYSTIVNVLHFVSYWTLVFSNKARANPSNNRSVTGVGKAVSSPSNVQKCITFCYVFSSGLVKFDMKIIKFDIKNEI